ncbi:hypothetical protein AU106_gp234 [Sinorhizobium phage phiM9]|uniref:Uncharacterized protein n=1 Tax=Sinorhizobium phage phiM9 TaxID=1636182 RepID=A0A0F6R636_9CAUD|nr:hypothetical protein AU106_gp234 [Sinorhizobium phage phiM9]AKE44865.1 hypothetical protein Sm_phiM9_238 [Sinorhizobium phage phiM9]
MFEREPLKKYERIKTLKRQHGMIPEPFRRSGYTFIGVSLEDHCEKWATKYIREIGSGILHLRSNCKEVV